MPKTKVTTSGIKFTVRVLMSKATLEHFQGLRSKARESARENHQPSTIKLTDVLKLELAVSFRDYTTHDKLHVVYDKHTDGYWSQVIDLDEAEYQPIRAYLKQVEENETLTLCRFFKQLAVDSAGFWESKRVQENIDLHKWLHAHLTGEQEIYLANISRSITSLLKSVPIDHPLNKSPLIYWLGNARGAIMAFMRGEVPEER